ncbi:LPS biosynthesis protein [Nocardioides phosphati]|uniref:LPS biosynthesis protein n=1 Tax=Nocardioides phosphati TaxID=1867775 RepID=A0ABQ2NEK0_9ACTN|nr:DegT/DnrJ/EryC1/StrS family aminotransferase [Nocardioides phosphati]GGO92530.1 LPS biosynthesis protein [Nocardioides phosphati]
MTGELPPLPFALPDVGEEEIAAVAETIRSGWVTTGPKAREFEERFAASLGEGIEAVAVNSATAGLHLALEAIGIGPGDEVLVPTWTFTATAEVVRYLGAEPILVDVCADTLNIDFAAAAEKVTERTRAIMPVHIAGYPIDAKALAAFADRHFLKVVEDAAHAYPCADGDQRVGAGTSEATVFSFYATKTMTTGEGGMLVTRDPEIAQRARVMRLHGISRDAFDRYRSTASPWRYEVVAPGYKYNLPDPAAAMGLVQLSRAEEMRGKRQAIAERYLTAFADLDVELPPVVESGVHAWHLFIIRLADEAARDAFVAYLSSLKIGTSVHFIPLHFQPVWRDRAGHVASDFPVASREFDRVVSLPIFSSMNEAQVERVIAATREALA